MEKYDVSFEFLGKRDYIHSTSLIYKLFDILLDNKHIFSMLDITMLEAVFKKKMRNNGYFLFTNDVIDEYSALFTLRLNNSKLKVYYVEDDIPVNNRVEYDEDGLVSEGKVMGDSVSINILSENAIINIIVALNKKLLHYLLPNDKYTSWSAGRIHIDIYRLYSILSSKADLELTLLNNINNIYTKSDIKVNNTSCGYICFARGEK